MSYSTQRAVSDGSLQLLMVSIQFFDKSEISVYLDNVPTSAYTWATDKSIRMDAVVPEGIELMLKRTTDLSQVRHVFSAGAQFKDSTLDEDFLQILHIAQEAVEGSNVGDIYSTLDMHGNRITNVGVATNDRDAVSLGQVKVESQSAWVAANQAQASQLAAAYHANQAAISSVGAFNALNACTINNEQAQRASESSLLNNQQSFQNLQACTINNEQSQTARIASEAAAVTATTQANRAKTEADRATAATDGKQDKSPVLTGLSGLTGTAADKLIMATGANTFAVKPITALAQTLIACATKEDMQLVIGAPGSQSRLFATEVLNPATFDDGKFWGFKANATGLGNGNKANLYSFVIDSDDLKQRAGLNGMSGSKVEGLGMRHKFGGPECEGGRHAGGFLLHQIFPTSGSNLDRNYVGVQGHVITGCGDGGTLGNPLGAYFAGSGFTAVIEEAYHVMNSTAWEFNSYIAKGVGAKAGTRVNVRTGIQIADYIEERGYGADGAISVGCLGGPGNIGHKNGMIFSNLHGGYAFGTDSVGFKFYPSCSATAAIEGIINLAGVSTEYLIRTSNTNIAERGIALNSANVSDSRGDPNTASVVTYSARTGGMGASYDFQMIYSSGSATVGKGILQMAGDAIIVPFGRPDGDATRDWGLVNFRFKTFWASTGTINTSDAREKTPVRKLNAAELAAAKDLSREVGIYQWTASVAEKGEDKARLFSGMTVQRAIEILEAHGLDPFRYSFICYDEWEATPAVYNTNQEGETTLVHPEVKAGNLYSFRVTDLHSFMIAGLNARLEAAGF